MTHSDIAKNYLSESHIKELNRIVSAYLDLAENRTERQNLMTCGCVVTTGSY